jgi:hypothetical protein
MVNVIEIGKAYVTAYNDKNWSKTKDSLAADAVYEEKATHRRIQGAGAIIEAWQGWANAFPGGRDHRRAGALGRRVASPGNATGAGRPALRIHPPWRDGAATQSKTSFP